ncbi:hypothetical protein F4780DRAFT_78765 [Xylariomycetidae sp. FL0641]|nr:hypothetical protein F4780DRAFT_78765 [Xylariomycetidae sp. FL0641]
MANHVSVSWQAPELGLLKSQVNGSNCTLATDWGAALVESLQRDNETDDYSLDTLIPYLQSMVPRDWENGSSYINVAAWAVNLLNAENVSQEYASQRNDFLVACEDHALFGCGTTLCPKLGWEGDPDVFGIGILVSYYILASLATLYFFVLAADRHWQLKTRKFSGFKLARLLSAFEESTTTFLQATLIFSIGQLSAAAFNFLNIRRNPDNEYTIYGVGGGVLVSTFSIFPPLILQTVSGGIRGQWFQLAMWLAVIVLALDVEIRYRTQDVLPLDHSELRLQTQLTEIVWNFQCSTSTSLGRDLTGINFAAHAMLGINFLWWLYYLLISTRDALKKWKGPRADDQNVTQSKWWNPLRKLFKLWEAWRTRLRLLNGFACMVTMWVLLAFCHVYSVQARRLGGSSVKDNTWTFGQILALTTWLAVLLDFLNILVRGAEKGLQQRLTTRWQVTKSEQGRGGFHQVQDTESMPFSRY